MSFLSCEEMLAAARSQKITLAEAVLRSDLEESRLTEEQSRAAMHHLWQVMQATSREYDPAQRSRSGLSGGDAAKVEQAHKEGKLLGGDYLSAVTAEALKTAECNACMKRIVAAPTAGSCGVLPAVLLPLAFVWAVVRHLCALPMVLRRRTAGAALPWLLLFGLLAMAALRCGMIAFVEVSSFGIGTSTMYLSTVHPLLLLYTYGCLICYRNKGVITE